MLYEDSQNKFLAVISLTSRSTEAQWSLRCKLHQEEHSSHCTSVGSDNGSKDILIPIGSKDAIA